MIFSVIISTYNADVHLRRAIDSVFFQDFSNDIELLIVDGCSTDNTIDILRENSDRISWWVSEEDSGIYDAWNKAILHAKGDWIIFLGADDVFYDKNVIGKFYEKTKILKKDIDIVYGMVALTDKAGETWLLEGEPWSKFLKI
ncbi:glycosyltransferase [Desulfobulbus sp. TB]|nr:glycosyltransferase [Desulfobulbus sp. TB]